ncbi:hypothetical protein N7G274_009581 [Stereocaulon virgatum]|uniref:Uncharacterized protein n=1 Tax=Stereocaulon virgatum TaxID=373712 RepID=A0ABR3ZY45_9LECA
MVFDRISQDRTRVIIRIWNTTSTCIQPFLRQLPSAQLTRPAMENCMGMGNALIPNFSINSTGELELDWKTWLTVTMGEDKITADVTGYNSNDGGISRIHIHRGWQWERLNPRTKALLALRNKADI